MSYSLNSLKWDIGDYYAGYQGGYQELAYGVSQSLERYFLGSPKNKVHMLIVFWGLDEDALALGDDYILTDDYAENRYLGLEVCMIML